MNPTDINNLLPRLQRWYRAQCDGEWEHSGGVKIGTLDNPGWSLEINLKSASLTTRPFTPIKHRLDTAQTSTDWLTCYVEDQTFKGFGGPDKLADMIAIFLNWAEFP